MLRAALRTALAFVTIAAPSTLAGPPATRVDPVVEEMHGVTMTDAYRWLEALEVDSPEVEAWTTEQNQYTRGILDTLPGRAALEERLSELMSIGQISLPAMRGNHYFYTERAGDQNQPVLYERQAFNGAPRVLIDPNTLDEEGLISLDWFVPSGDGDLLAFGLSHAGDEMSVLHILDVPSGQWLAEEISGKAEFGGWAPDRRGFLYGILEDPGNAYSRVFKYHEIGRHHRHDPVLLRQEEPSRIPDAFLSRNGRWFITTVFEGWSNQEILVVDAEMWRRTDDFDPQPIAVGLGARFEPQFVNGDTLYLLTTLNAPNGMLYGVDLNHPHRDRWNVVIPERPDAVLRGADLARGMMVAIYQKNVTTSFERMEMDGRTLGELDLPGLGSATLSTRFDRTEAFIAYTSFNEPTSIYRVDLVSGTRTLWERPDVPVDPSSIVVKQEWCTSSDGTRLPMFIVHKKGLRRDGKTPTLLYGYGGFNISLTPRFVATNFPWLEKGGIYVTVNLRGGGEFGEAWHQAGMLGRKQNVFDDLYAAAEHVIEAGYTSPEHLAVLGGSNGGLLTGVAATQRPELWAAVVSAVPLLDMLRYQNLLMARFWVPEYGDPTDAEHFGWLRAYSPYHNITEGRQDPAILFTAGENDNRVHPMHARKMVAAMQAAASNDLEKNPIMLWVDRDGGHGRGKPLDLRIRDTADRWSFIMDQTGMYYDE